jgi:hypothetical protein
MAGFEQSMAATSGAAEGLTGILGGMQSMSAQRQAIKLKQSENRINKGIVKADYKRDLTSLLAHQDDIDDSVQTAAMKREGDYKKSLGTMKVMQAERGISGKSANASGDALSKANTLSENLMLGNMKIAQRKLLNKREGMASQHDMQLLGLEMDSDMLKSKLGSINWGQIFSAAGAGGMSGASNYINLMKSGGRGGGNWFGSEFSMSDGVESDAENPFQTGAGVPETGGLDLYGLYSNLA